MTTVCSQILPLLLPFRPTGGQHSSPGPCIALAHLFAPGPGGMQLLRFTRCHPPAPALRRPCYRCSGLPFPIRRPRIYRPYLAPGTRVKWVPATVRLKPQRCGASGRKRALQTVRRIWHGRRTLLNSLSSRACLTSSMFSSRL